MYRKKKKQPLFFIKESEESRVRCDSNPDCKINCFIFDRSRITGESISLSP